MLIALDWLYTTVIHTLSIGDGFQVAPDGELICPQAEPISEDIKYRLFNLDIAEADLHICEGDSITRLQSAGLDLEFCTFHSNDETLGLSWQLQGLTVTGLLPDVQEPSLYLQVGLLDLHHVQGDLELREPLECVPKRQLRFLRKADFRTQRLWFLWRESGASAKCGCCGGCLFIQDAIHRKPALLRCDSAVYRPQFAPCIPRHLAMQGLNGQLLASCISVPDCLWSLHRGLMGHYQARYANVEPALHTPAGATPTDTLQERYSKGLSFSDDASFVSARSSLTSLLAAEHKSDENLVEEVAKKVGSQSVDWRSDDDDDGGSGGGSGGGNKSYRALAKAQYLHTVTLQIPYSNPCAPAGYRVQSASGTSSTIDRHTPDTMLPCCTQFHLRMPCLSQDSAAGGCPLLTQKSSIQTLERRRRVKVVSDGKNTNLAKFSLSIRLNEANSVVFSPPFLKIVSR